MRSFSAPTFLLDRHFLLTHHARRRMRHRALSAEAIALALAYGRVFWLRNADIYVIGRREVADAAGEGVDLSAHEGVQVVCTPEGVVLTTYRNRDFRSLRPRRRRPRPHWRRTRSLPPSHP
jgi:hypothetical protein